MKKRFVALVLAAFMFAGAFALPVVAGEGDVDCCYDVCTEYFEIAPRGDLGLVGVRPRCGGDG